MAIGFALLSANSANAASELVATKRLLIPKEAQSLVFNDQILIRKIDPIASVFMRYIWLREPTKEKIQQLHGRLNRISRNTITKRFPVLYNGNIIRVDLRDLTENREQLQEYIDTWELLRFDPNFNLLLTPNAQELILQLDESKQPVALVREDTKFVPYKLKDLAKRDVIRVVPGHLDINTLLGIQIQAQSAAVIVESDYFTKRASESIRDDGPYKDIWGGLYYDFLGLRKLAKKGESDLDGLLRYLGGQIVDSSENRTAIEFSLVHGRPRAIGFYPTRARPPLEGQSWITITEDVKRKSIDFDQNALATLDRRFFKPDAKEAIWVMKNGMLGYALYNGQDILQDSAPDDVVVDRTLPEPYETVLQASSSCERCHEVKGHSGLQPVGNDILRYLDAGLDVFGDVKDPNAAVDDTLKRLAQQYKARPDKFLREGRFGYQAAFLEATGSWNGKPIDIVTLGSREYERGSIEYWSSRVTPVKAARDLGLVMTPDKLTPSALRLLLPPRVQDSANGVMPADIRVDRVAAGFTLNRVEWSLSYAFAQQRAIEAVQGLKP